MIKVIIHIAKVIITIVTSMLFFSCGFETVDGNGRVTSQTRDTGAAGFTEIEASGGIEVFIAQGSSPSIKVEADSNLQELIETKVSGGRLTITTKKNVGHATSKKVVVVVPKITEIESAKGVLVKTTTTINADNIKLTSGGGGSLEATIAAKKAELQSNNGSSLTVSGKVATLKATSSSGSSLHAGSLSADTIEAEATSGGNATVMPLNKLKAKAANGGKLTYIKSSGNLKIDISESSGGSVSQQ